MPLSLKQAHFTQEKVKLQPLALEQVPGCENRTQLFQSACVLAFHDVQVSFFGFDTSKRNGGASLKIRSSGQSPRILKIDARAF